jgi:hypothetical protein
MRFLGLFTAIQEGSKVSARGHLALRLIPKHMDPARFPWSRTLIGPQDFDLATICVSCCKTAFTSSIFFSSCVNEGSLVARNNLERMNSAMLRALATEQFAFRRLYSSSVR